MKRAGQSQNRQRERRTRPLAEPQIEVEQGPRLQCFEHEAVPLLGRTMRKQEIGTTGGIEPRRRKRGDGDDETIDKDGTSALGGSDDGTTDRSDFEPADGTED